jgi:hypothetical protein
MPIAQEGASRGQRGAVERFGLGETAQLTQDTGQLALRSSDRLVRLPVRPPVERQRAAKVRLGLGVQAQADVRLADGEAQVRFDRRLALQVRGHAPVKIIQQLLQRVIRAAAGVGRRLAQQLAQRSERGAGPCGFGHRTRFIRLGTGAELLLVQVHPPQCHQRGG